MIYFDGTTKDLVLRVEDLPVQEETTIARLLADYEAQLETPGQQIHTEYLLQAYELFKQAVWTKGLSPERVHLAAEIYYHLCLWDEFIQVLQRYLESQPGTYEQLWANWCITDSHALQRHYQEVVRRQPEQLRWADDMHIPPAHQLCILNDATQALCWWMLGRDVEWRCLLSDLLQRVVPTAQNREDRFLAVRTAVSVLDFAHQTTEGLDWLQRLYAIARETDPDDQHEFLLEANALHIKLATINNEKDKVREIAARASARIQWWIKQASGQPREGSPVTSSSQEIGQDQVTSSSQKEDQITSSSQEEDQDQVTDLSREQRRLIRKAAHNVGASLYEAHEYALAIPFFQLAIQYGTIPFHSYLWLAGAKWKTGAGKPEVIALLKQAAEHDAGQKLPRKIWELPEFQDAALQEDKDFQALCHRTSDASFS